MQAGGEGSGVAGRAERLAQFPEKKVEKFFRRFNGLKGVGRRVNCIVLVWCGFYTSASMPFRSITSSSFLAAPAGFFVPCSHF